MAAVAAAIRSFSTSPPLRRYCRRRSGITSTGTTRSTSPVAAALSGMSLNRGSVRSLP